MNIQANYYVINLVRLFAKNNYLDRINLLISFYYP